MQSNQSEGKSTLGEAMHQTPRCVDAGDEGEEDYDEGEWEVEELLAKRKNKDTKEEEFKVLWAGFDGDTVAEGSTSWEPASWLEAEGYDGLIAAFKHQAKAKAVEKQRKSEATTIVQPKYTKLQEIELKKHAELLARASLPSSANSDLRPLNVHRPSKKITDSFEALFVELQAQEKNREVLKKESEELLAALKQSAAVSHCDFPTAPTAGGERSQQQPIVEADQQQGAKGGGILWGWGEDREKKGLADSAPPQHPEKTALSAAADYINTFESIFLRGGNLIEPTILRLLGSAQWDVKKAWTQQLARDGVDGPKPVVGEDTLNNVVDEEEDEEEEYDEEQENENFFMAAPTTFHESADILLEVMSFSTNGDFFNACQVNNRWHHVGRKMGEARGLVRSFALGLQRSFTRCGVVPIALASAGTDTSVLKKLYRQSKRELSDPAYHGRNGGALVPLYNLEVGELDASKDLKITRVQESYGKVRYVSHRGASGGLATLLDPTVPPRAPSTAEHPYGAGEATLCISVGRLPTASSAGRVDLHNPAGGGLRFGEGYKPGFQTSIHYGVGSTDQAVPVLYVRVLFLCAGNIGDRERLSNAVSSGWDGVLKIPDAADKSVNLKHEKASSRKREEAERLQKKFWTEKTMTQAEIDARDASEQRRLEEERILGERQEVELQQKRVAAAIKASALWNSLCDSLPPPKILWKSFAPVRPPVCLPGALEPAHELWFKPPNLKRTTTGSSDTKKKDQIVRSVLSHADTLEKLQLARARTLIGKNLTDEQQRSMQFVTRKLWDHSSDCTPMASLF